MSEWIHCNKCFVRYNTNIKLFLSECAHIFCAKCVEKIRETKKCSICDKPSSVLLLSKDMESNVQQYFMPLDTLQKKVIEVYNFQATHRNRLLQNLMLKYNYAKMECVKCKNANRQLAQENRMLKSILKSAGNNPHAFATSTPAAMTSDNSDIDMSSVVSSIPTHMTPSASMKNLIMSTPNNMRPGYPQRMVYGDRRQSMHQVH